MNALLSAHLEAQHWHGDLRHVAIDSRALLKREHVEVADGDIAGTHGDVQRPHGVDDMVDVLPGYHLDLAEKEDCF